MPVARPRRLTARRIFDIVEIENGGRGGGPRTRVRLRDGRVLDANEVYYNAFTHRLTFFDRDPDGANGHEVADGVLVSQVESLDRITPEHEVDGLVIFEDEFAGGA
jgi:hypothetical protein